MPNNHDRPTMQDIADHVGCCPRPSSHSYSATRQALVPRPASACWLPRTNLATASTGRQH